MGGGVVGAEGGKIRAGETKEKKKKKIETKQLLHDALNKNIYPSRTRTKLDL